MSRVRRTMILPALRCPWCEAVDLDENGRACLSPQSSRLVGASRERHYLCRVCHERFKVILRLDWQAGDGSDSDRAEVIEER